MNKMLFALAVTVAALAGCATTTSARPASAPLPPPVEASPVPAYDPSLAAAAMPVVPPPRPEAMMGPPQNWAWLHTPPMGCDRGPNSLIIRNDTEYFMRVQLDGEDLMVRGAQGMLPQIPPGTHVYVCLAHTGMHSLSGVAYTTRYGMLQEVEGDYGRFQIQQSFGSAVDFNGHVNFLINFPLLVCN